MRAPTALPFRDPLARVTELGTRDGMRAVVFGVLFAVIVHGSLAAWAALIRLELIRWTQDARAQLHQRLLYSCDIDLEKMNAPDPPPVVPEDPAPVPPPPTKTVANVEPAQPRIPEAPAPVPVGPLLTAPSDPLDTPTDGPVVGSAPETLGGFRGRTGTSTTPVHNPAAHPNGVGAGTAPAPAPRQIARDQSGPATRNGASDWRCPWPAEADDIDEAYVTIQVTVNADGRAGRVAVLADPGHGFAREARSCAMRERYGAAHDRDGSSIAGDTKAFRIHFER